MPKTKYAAKGTLFKRGTGSPLVFTTIGEIFNVGGPSLSREALDATAHGDADKEFIGGLRDGGEVNLEMHFDPADAGDQALLADMQEDSPGDYQIVFPDSATTTFQFAALVTAFEVQAPVDGKLTASVTLKVSGAVDFDA